MTFDEAVETLRGWVDQPVVIRLDPDGTLMTGRLSELDSTGIDGALFGVDSGETSGVAVALFRDGVRSAVAVDHGLVIEQGRVTVTVTRGRPPG